MTIMNKIFNINRFWNLLKIEFRLESKPLIINTSVTLVFYLMLLGIVGSAANGLMWFVWGVMLFTSIVGLFLMSAEVCGNVRSHNNFRAFNLLPASNFEKFSARMLVCHVIPVAIWVALSFLLYCNDDVVERIKFNNDNYPAHVVIVFLIVWLTSLCAFWGTMFRKLGIIAFAVFVTGFIALSVNVLDDINLMFMDPIMRYVASDPSFGNMFIVIGSVVAVFCLINYVASYFVFCRKELNFKLFNW